MKGFKSAVPLIFFIALCFVYVVNQNLLGINDVSLDSIISAVSAQELNRRMIWGLSLVGFYVASMVGISICGMVYWQAGQALWLKRKWHEILVIVILLLVIGWFFSKGAATSSSINADLYELVKDNVQICNKNKTGDEKCRSIAVNTITNVVMVVVFAFLFMLSLSLAVLLKGLSKADLNDLSVRYRKYRLQFYSTAALLVLGLIQVFFLNLWLVSVLSVSNKTNLPDEKIIESYALFTSMGAALLYSFVFLLMFIPVSYFLRDRYMEIASQLNFKDDTEKKIWENKYGFSERPVDKAKDFLVMMSPFITGVFANILNNIENLIPK